MISRKQSNLPTIIAPVWGRIGIRALTADSQCGALCRHVVVHSSNVLFFFDGGGLVRMGIAGGGGKKGFPQMKPFSEVQNLQYN